VENAIMSRRRVITLKRRTPPNLEATAHMVGLLSLNYLVLPGGGGCHRAINRNHQSSANWMVRVSI
jgi:hypothetical protein